MFIPFPPATALSITSRAMGCTQDPCQRHLRQSQWCATRIRALRPKQLKVKSQGEGWPTTPHAELFRISPIQRRELEVGDPMYFESPDLCRRAADPAKPHSEYAQV